ncbi:hypothetical protein [Actinomadura sp. HBU206391]|uniref:hypothetical protein n=1 Tax=Actinomadura sp. HBU206391 TaxID=2731692 RepID=UPI0016501498|nr:hypothetical protein [Actinomadura sp. HBU206391]MBC6462267.1 hypothetical protein [Actinomadura sp. HBU206391]
MTFEVNGYRLSELVRDPVAVERSLADLGKVLAAARTRMTHLGRHDLADRLDALSRQLQASEEVIDDAFDHAFKEVTGAAADACAEAAGPDGIRSPDDRNAHIYQALTWGLVDLVTVRIGGHGTIEHPGGCSTRSR